MSLVREVGSSQRFRHDEALARGRSSSALGVTMTHYVLPLRNQRANLSPESIGAIAGHKRWCRRTKPVLEMLRSAGH
jgi:hypothetical protein